MIRTDLALESAALSGEAELPGISVCRVQKHGLELTTVTVQNEEGARAIGKPPGRYITLETNPIGETALTGTAEAALLGESLSSLLPSEGTLLVACLGNAAITPDALGPRSARWVLATRHVAGREQLFRRFRPVAVLAPGVLGQTGIETAGLIRTVARENRRFGGAGHRCPGSPGCGTAGAHCSDRRLRHRSRRRGGEQPGGTLPADAGGPGGIHGDPTVVDCRTLLHDLGLPTPPGVPESLVVTPKDVDLLIDRGAHLIGMAVNRAAQPLLTAEEIALLIA